jgi:hypothetical protein
MVGVVCFGLSNQRNDIRDEFTVRKIVEEPFLYEMSIFIHNQLFKVVVLRNQLKESSMMPLLDFKGECLVDFNLNIRL